MLISEALIKFQVEYISLRGLTRSTEENYCIAVLSFKRAVADKELFNITPMDMLTWRRWMERRNKTTTIRCHMSKLKNILEFTNKNGLSNFDTTDIHLPKLPPPLPEVLSPEEIQQMIEIATPRDKAMISLMFTSGIRAGELCRLVRSDISNNQIFIRKGKGNTSRSGFMSPQTQTFIQQYLNTREDNSAVLFQSYRGGHLCTGAINHLIKQYGKDAHLDKPVHSHMIRHSFATTLVKGGTDISYVQRMMGHAFLNTTMVYVHLSNGDLKQAHARVFR